MSSRPFCSASTANSAATMPPTLITAAPMTNAMTVSPTLPLLVSLANSSGPVMPPSGGPDRVEEGDRHRAGLHREDLADRQVGRAGARPRRRTARPSSTPSCVVADQRAPASNSHAVTNSSTPDGDVGAGDHRLAADGVEEAAEQQRAEEVADRDRRRSSSRSSGRRRGRTSSGSGVAEGDRVVEERLPDEQRQARARSASGSVVNTVLAIVRKPIARRWWISMVSSHRLGSGSPVSSLDRRPRRRRRSRSASSSRPWMNSHRGLSGTLRRTSRMTRPSTTPSAERDPPADVRRAGCSCSARRSSSSAPPAAPSQ